MSLTVYINQLAWRFGSNPPGFESHVYGLKWHCAKLHAVSIYAGKCSVRRNAL